MNYLLVFYQLKRECCVVLHLLGMLILWNLMENFMVSPPDNSCNLAISSNWGSYDAYYSGHLFSFQSIIQWLIFVLFY